MTDIFDFFPSQFLKASDCTPPIVLTMLEVRSETVGDDTKPVMSFRDDKRELVVNKTNSITIANTLGSNTLDWCDRQIELRAEKVNFGGRIVDGIRVRVMGEAPTPAPAY